MRPLFILPVALVFAATSASAQTTSTSATTYLCTPGSQVIAVPPTGAPTLLKFTVGSSQSTTVPSPDPAGLTECVLGPDGKLYAANGFKVIRFVPNAVVPAGGVETVVSNLAFASRGLAFNLSTLYISLANDTRVAVANATGAGGVNGNTLTAVAAGSGGLVFDIPGNLVTTSNGAVRKYAPPYTGNAISQDVTVLLPRGAAVDTCGDVLVADKSSQSVKRLSDGSVAVQFDRKDFPVAVENDAANRLHILTVEDDAGTNAKYWVATAAAFATSNCGSLTATQRVAVKDLTSGQTALAGLLSNKALGLAAGNVDVTITRPFSTADCSEVFDFGYHRVEFSFDDCASVPANSTLTMTAVKSRPVDVKFDALTIDPQQQMKGMRYSPLGGHVIQYLLVPNAALASMDRDDRLFFGKYGFFTQESVQEPGIARHTSEIPSDAFTSIVGADYWDIGSLDPAGGERERDFSKRVVYNKSLLAFPNCAVPNLLDNPLDHQNPLFNGGQNIKVSFTAIGANCAGAIERLSVVRVSDVTLNGACQVISSGPSASYEPQIVRPTNRTPAEGDENVFEVVGSSYRFNLDTTVLNIDGATAATPAQFIITIWGQLAPPKNFCFQFSKQ